MDVSEVRCLPKCPAQGLSSYCYDRTCTKYVLCFAGEPVLRECSDGLQYNAMTDRCDYPQYVDCVDNLCVRDNNAAAITYIASKSLCDKYYICVDGLPANQTCAPGLQYNPACQCCDFPSRANCTVRICVCALIPLFLIDPFNSGGDSAAQHSILCQGSATFR